MKITVEELACLYHVTACDLSAEQAQQLVEFVKTLMFTQPEELDPYLKVAKSEALRIIENIQSGRNDGPPSPFGGPNKINDIIYVRGVTDAGLMDAKNFVEKYFNYYTEYLGAPMQRTRLFVHN